MEDARSSDEKSVSEMLFSRKRPSGGAVMGAHRGRGCTCLRTDGARAELEEQVRYLKRHERST